jgi:aspartokinase
MTQLSEIIRDEMQTSPSIRIDIQKNIINIRALAKHIKKRGNLAYSLDAIISAIRRYQETIEEKIDEEPKKLMINSKLSVKNQISSIMLDKNEEVLKTLPKIFEKVEMVQHTVLRIVHAQRSLKIFVDQALLAQVTSLFSEKNIKKIEKDLGEVIIDLNEKSWRKLGILSTLTSQMYLNRINIIECLTCIPEIVFIVKEDDLMKAYEVLYSISKGKEQK